MITPTWVKIKGFLAAYPWHLTIFGAAFLWEYLNWRERQERQKLHTWLNYQFLEARERGLARELPYAPLKDEDEEDEEEQLERNASDLGRSEPVFDIDVRRAYVLCYSRSAQGIPTATDVQPFEWASSEPSASPATSSVSQSVTSAIAGLSRLLSRQTESRSAAAAPLVSTTTEFAVEPKTPQPAQRFTEPVHRAVSLAEAVPIMLSPEEKKELKRRQKAEQLDLLRNADLDIEAPERTFKSPKEIYARELAVFEPRKYSEMLALESRAYPSALSVPRNCPHRLCAGRLNAKKRARIRISPRKLAKLSKQNKEQKAEAKLKLQNSIRSVGALLNKANSFDKDAQLAVLTEKKQARQNMRKKLSPAQKQAAELGMMPVQQDKSRVTEAARARFAPGTKGGEES